MKQRKRSPDRRQHGGTGSRSSRGIRSHASGWRQHLLAALICFVTASSTQAASWQPGYVLINHETVFGSEPADYLRVLDSKGERVQDVLISSAPKWTAADDIAWSVAAPDGRRIFLVSSQSHGIYSIDTKQPHEVSYMMALPDEIRGVAITDVDSLTVDAELRLYAGVSTGCLANSPASCIGSYVVRYNLADDPDSAKPPRPIKVEAFPFVTHDLAMSQDGSILYGLDDPTLFGGVRAIRQLNLTTMVPLPAFVVKENSLCSALAAGGEQGPIIACHGQKDPIDTKPAALEGQQARPVNSKVSNAVATATRLATNTKVNATYVWAYSPAITGKGATLTKVDTSTGEAITKDLTDFVPATIRALTVVPGEEANNGVAAARAAATRTVKPRGRRLRAFLPDIPPIGKMYMHRLL